MKKPNGEDEIYSNYTRLLAEVIELREKVTSLEKENKKLHEELSNAILKDDYDAVVNHYDNILAEQADIECKYQDLMCEKDQYSLVIDVLVDKLAYTRKNAIKFI